MNFEVFHFDEKTDKIGLKYVNVLIFCSFCIACNAKIYSSGKMIETKTLCLRLFG